ncbi:MAG TPA: NAD(P)-dependent oxidoreductase, partial [Planctomycetota bacterium]|nr:NAD(P)-dependent oxidoreductase [Planctomycetota bacterium]
MKVLLTGATGFIGSHVARELLGRGHEVHATLRRSSDRRRIREIEGRLRIHEGEMDLIPLRPDVAIHLAWYAVPGKYLTAPENRDCLAGSRRLLQALPCRAIFAGTCFEFDTRIGRLGEESPTRPTTLYAECKDALRREVVQRPDSAWIRFFYQFGPWEDERRLVPSVIRSVLRGEPAKVSPGEQQRDFLHIEDVASAVCAVAESTLEGCVNIGSGESPTIKEIVTRIGVLGGRGDLIRLGEVPYYEGEPMLIVADNARLRSTGWTRKYTLESGLRDVFCWWKGR